MTVDVGTGDGRAVLVAAAREPTTLALGIDANAAAMAEVSRRAARPARRGGLPNAAFITAAAETLPTELAGIAEIVTVRFPWGSLLRGAVGLDPAVAAGLAGLLAPTGCLELVLAPSRDDPTAGVPADAGDLATAVREAFVDAGLAIDQVRVPTGDEIAAIPSSWARRLLADGRPDRRVVIVRLRRTSGTMAQPWPDDPTASR